MKFNLFHQKFHIVFQFRMFILQTSRMGQQWSD